MTDNSTSTFDTSPPPPSAGNLLLQGDNLPMLQRYVADDSVDLIYHDPPFNSRIDYGLDGWQAVRGGVVAFRDMWRWDGAAEQDYAALLTGADAVARCMAGFRLMLGAGAMLAYLTMMAPRMVQLHRVLKPTGSLYLHCDHAASHYLKLLLDAVFGPRQFRNELIWHYQSGGGSRKRFSRKHDVIFFYSKSAQWKFYGERIAIPRADGALKRAQRLKGARIAADDTTKHPHDVLLIQHLNPMANERRGYPTQKPEELLARLILASSDVGDLVLDPGCGSGTALAVAERLGRRWLGIDQSVQAIERTQARLAGADYTFIEDDREAHGERRFAPTDAGTI